MNLSELQSERNDWVARNFPNDSLDHSFKGVVEEVGELSHHLLKREQGIRGDEEFHTVEIRDAVCDLVIFAAGIATHEGFDFGEAVQETWDRVKNRNWVADPKTGGINELP